MKFRGDAKTLTAAQLHVRQHPELENIEKSDIGGGAITPNLRRLHPPQLSQPATSPKKLLSHCTTLSLVKDRRRYPTPKSDLGVAARVGIRDDGRYSTTANLAVFASYRL